MSRMIHHLLAHLGVLAFDRPMPRRHFDDLGTGFTFPLNLPSPPPPKATPPAPTMTVAEVLEKYPAVETRRQRRERLRLGTK